MAIGDPVTFTPDFVELSPGVVATQALDDRAGVYAVVRALELYAAAPGAARLTGLRHRARGDDVHGRQGARRCGCAPDVLIVVDGDFCSDTPAADAKELAGEVKLGAGPVLGRGAGSNQRLLALAREVAAAEGIPVQVKAAPEAMSTDADELMAAGTAATLVARACRCATCTRRSRSPTCDDLEAAARLVAALARRVGERRRRRPRVRPFLTTSREAP